MEEADVSLRHTEKKSDNNRHRRVSLPGLSSVSFYIVRPPLGEAVGWRGNVAYHLVFLFASQEAFAVCSDLCFLFINTSLDISCQCHKDHHLLHCHCHHHLFQLASIIGNRSDRTTNITV